MAAPGGILKLFLPFWFFIESFLKNCVDLFVPASFRTQKDVAGEVVLVTGGGAGLGRSIAVQLAKLNATVVTWDINRQGNEETARMIREQDGDAHAYTVDISIAEDVYAAADKVRREVGDITMLVNNAAIGQSKPVWTLSDPLIQKMMEVNALAHFWLFKAFLPAMKANNHGHMVTILSGSVNLVPMHFGAYIASKSAALGLHQALQTDLAFEHRTGIETTVAFLDYIATDMTIGRLNCGRAPILSPDEVAEKIVQGIQLNKSIVTTSNKSFIFYLMKNFIPLKFFLMLFRIGRTDTPFLDVAPAGEDGKDKMKDV